MLLSRRHILKAGGGVLAALLVRPLPITAAEVIDVSMQGSAGGSHVWFDPIGIHVMPGQTLRWTNADAGNAHTVTACHPQISSRPLRIPAVAQPWDSGYLLPEEFFEVTLTDEGVYDYYCVPHEHAGMVGRIVVGQPGDGEPFEAEPSEGLEALPEAALGNFPPVEKILAEGRVAAR